VVTWGTVTAIVVPAVRAPSRQPRLWHATRVVAAQLATVPVMVAGCSLLGWPDGGLYWLAAGILCAVIAATGHAWVLLVEVVRDERYYPLDEARPVTPAQT
jgi:hypothetical protein